MMEEERDRKSRGDRHKSSDRKKRSPSPHEEKKSKNQSPSPDSRRKKRSDRKEDEKHRSDKKENTKTRSPRENDKEKPKNKGKESSSEVERKDTDRKRKNKETNTEERIIKRQKKEEEVDSTKQKWGKEPSEESGEESQEKEKPDFKPSGALHRNERMVRGVEIKYAEPEDAKKPTIKWRLYPFKDDKPLEALNISKKSFFLLGRERRISDIPLDHPSCSSQHAVIQFRSVYIKDESTGETRLINRPYIIDLNSTNGTFLNGTKIDDSRYFEMFEKDVLKFGFSSREYVLLHENSK